MAAPRAASSAIHPKLSQEELERITRRYTAEILDYIGPERDVPAPDMNTNEQTMAWIMDTYSMHMRHTVTASVTGKPVDLGGSQGRREATGRGCMISIDEALKRFWWKRQETRVIVQGFGNVGSEAAKLLHEEGYKIIGVADVAGGVFNTNGLDIAALLPLRQGKRNRERIPRWRKHRDAGNSGARMRGAPPRRYGERHHQQKRS